MIFNFIFLNFFTLLLIKRVLELFLGKDAFVVMLTLLLILLLKLISLVLFFVELLLIFGKEFNLFLGFLFNINEKSFILYYFIYKALFKVN